MHTLTLDDDQLRLLTGLLAEYVVNQYRQSKRKDFTEDGRKSALKEAADAGVLLNLMKGRTGSIRKLPDTDSCSRFDAALRSLS